MPRRRRLRYATVDPEPVGYAEVDSAPVGIETYPSVVYEGHPTYFYGDRWYYLQRLAVGLLPERARRAGGASERASSAPRLHIGRSGSRRPERR